MKAYSLRKCKHILRHTFHRYKKKRKRLSPESAGLIKQALTALQEEILYEHREKADEIARQVESLSAAYLKKSSWDQLRELISALAFALIVAVLVRQMWFEFYEIPSGSMRPTLK
jgi:signal peptidase I